MVVQSLSIFFENPTLFSTICVFICNPESNKQGFLFPTSSPAFNAICFLDGAILMTSCAVPVAYFMHMHSTTALVSCRVCQCFSLKWCLPSFSAASALWSQTPLLPPGPRILSHLQQLRVGLARSSGLTAMVSQNLNCSVSSPLRFESFCFEISCYSDGPCLSLFCLFSILTIMWCGGFFSGPAHLAFHVSLVPG